MIDIRKGDNFYRVSKGSYEEYFKEQGFEIVNPKQEEVVEEVKVESEEKQQEKVVEEVKPKTKARTRK